MAAVILSAVLHAMWNYLLRRAGGDMTVAALSILAEAIMLVPLAVVAFYSSGGVRWATFLPTIAIGASWSVLNYEALMAAYRRGDMSLVYPVARGGVFLFLPLLGFLVFGERLDVSGWLAVALIVIGIMLLPLARLDRRSLVNMILHLRERPIAYAMLAAASTAAYTIWDKRAIGSINTYVYFSGYTILFGFWSFVGLARTPRSQIRAQWHRYRLSILAIGLLIPASYLLVLIALQDGVSTEVLAVRQLSIPIGVLLGWRFLRESLPQPRAIGSLLITAGCMLAATT
jgi:uncharacterized membrane protein